MWQEMFYKSVEYFYFSILKRRKFKETTKHSRCVLLRVMDFLVDHGLLWGADFTQRLGFGKINLNLESNVVTRRAA